MPKQKRRSRVGRIPYSSGIGRSSTRRRAAPGASTADSEQCANVSGADKLETARGKVASTSDKDGPRNRKARDIEDVATTTPSKRSKNPAKVSDISPDISPGADAATQLDNEIGYTGAARTGDTGTAQQTSIQLHDEIHIPGPPTRAIYTGIHVMPDDRIILADYENSVVKLIDTNHELADMVAFVQPYDVTAVGNDQVVATNPRKCQLQFISVTEKLTLGRTLATDGAYYGVVCCQKQLIVTCSTHTCVVILELTGAVLKRLPIYCNYPMYIAVDPDSENIHTVSSGSVVYSNGTVTCSRFDGRTVALGQFELPTGIAVHSDGSLYVCESVKKLHHITAQYDVIDTYDIGGLSGIHSMCCNQRGDRLYGTVDMCDIIKVFSICS